MDVLPTSSDVAAVCVVCNSRYNRARLDLGYVTCLSCGEKGIIMKLTFIVAILGLVVLFLYPFGLIWAVNTLFNSSIPCSFATYSAAFLLSSPFISPRKVS